MKLDLKVDSVGSDSPNETKRYTNDNEYRTDNNG